MGIAEPGQIKGCTDREVAELEEKINIALPEIYKTFLLKAGHKAGKFHVGTDMFYRHLFNLREFAEELLEENNVDLTLPKTAFVFLMHQGYQFLYFDSTLKNPPIYGYNEGNEGPQLLYKKFTDFLFADLEVFKNAL